MTDQTHTATAEETAPEDSTKRVPVAESIKYRRRAQAAEAQIEELQQKLQDVTNSLDGRAEELAQAEAQRDEAQQRITSLENRMTVERMLAEVRAVDIETASMLLAQRLDFSEPIESETLQRSVEQLLLDKPFLLGPLPAGTMPPVSASGVADTSEAGGVHRAARRAVETGSRRDVAEYLRLRRRDSAF